MATNKKPGNSGPIGMQGNSIEEAAKNVKTPDSSEFFNALEDQVNGSIIDKNTEATQQAGVGSQRRATRPQPPAGSRKVAKRPSSSSFEKRYKDSSREAVKLKRELDNLKPFVPVLDAMKKDSGLVDHVRDYLMNGGTPTKSIKEQLNLPENFVFDQQEAINNPDSDSAKVMQAQVDGLVQQRVGQVLNKEKQNSKKVAEMNMKKKQALAFKRKHRMSDTQFESFMNKAKNHVLTLDDVNYLMNRDKVAANTAKSTRKDMLKQMKNVQKMPTTASGANNQSTKKSPDNDVFDNILGLDGGVDNLFGD
jgi:hypothetical protein